MSWVGWDVWVNNVPAFRVLPDRHGNIELIVRTGIDARGHFGIDRDGKLFTRLSQGSVRLNPDIRREFPGLVQVAHFRGSSEGFGVGVWTSEGLGMSRGAISRARRPLPNRTTVLSSGGGTIVLGPPGCSTGDLPPGSRAIRPAGPSWLTIAFVPDPSPIG